VWLIDRAVEDALIARDQAAADLSHLGLEEFARGCATAANVPSSPSPKPRRKSAKKLSAKTCPRCGAPMVKRWGQQNGQAALFLGCSTYPRCHGTSAVRGRSAP
jgi:hypothetical protein